MATRLILPVLAGWISTANAQNNGSQVLKLPDPTPREISPDLRYHSDPSVPRATQKLTKEQIEKRWQLIVWATDELVVLSERADKAALAPPGETSKKDLEVNVTKIQVLAKNLTTALKAH